MRLLVVEDELDLQEAIVEGLTIDGYSVDSASDGEEAHEKIAIEQYDLIILDLNLPKMSGFELLEKVRKTDTQVKFLILSARSSVLDKVTGLDYGANDYLIKPFDFSELEARIRNLLRWEFASKNTILTYNNLSLNLASRAVHFNQQPIKLTKKEFAILEYLLLNQGKVVSQEALIEHVWSESEDASFSNSVRVHIVTLRKKLAVYFPYEIIETKIGEGYIINDMEAKNV
ncbi:response regulator transcription factor [Enterococcus sp. LJL90]